MAVEENTPVLVGCGQVTQKIDDPVQALNPIELMKESSLLAFEDSTIENLENKIDTIMTVRFIFDSGGGKRPPFSIYTNPPQSLANKLGILDAKTFNGPTGGNTPQYLINILSEKIATGETEIALLSGAECFSSMRKASKLGIKTGWGEDAGGKRIDLGFEKPGGTLNEMRHGITFPINVYPLFENAIRGNKDHSVNEHLKYLGSMFEPFTKVASENKHAWFPIYRSAEEISTPNKKNRFIGFPYTKYMNAIMEVDQSASIIIMSEKKANEYSVPESKRIYLHGCADINEVWNITERPELHRSSAIRLMGKKAFSMANWKVDEIDFYDLYSCFPSMVELGREALDISNNISSPLTVTGGLPFFGGAGNNYVTHSIATMMEKLRENQNSKGLCTSNGWYATKHGIGLYSNIPFEGKWEREDPNNYQKIIDNCNKPEVDENPTGNAKIETYTVANGRSGPQMAIIIGRLNSNNKRFIATSNYEKTLDVMMSDECLGRDCEVITNSEGYNTFSIKI